MVSRKEYTKEFKQEAVRMAQKKENKSRVVRDLGIYASMLSRWEKQYLQGSLYGSCKGPDLVPISA